MARDKSTHVGLHISGDAPRCGRRRTVRHGPSQFAQPRSYCTTYRDVTVDASGLPSASGSHTSGGRAAPVACGSSRWEHPPGAEARFGSSRVPRHARREGRVAQAHLSRKLPKKRRIPRCRTGDRDPSASTVTPLYSRICKSPQTSCVCFGQARHYCVHRGPRVLRTAPLAHRSRQGPQTATPTL